MRVPPTATPSVVSWIAMTAESPAARSWTITTSSWPSSRARSSALTFGCGSFLRPLVEPADHFLVPAHGVHGLQHPVVLVGKDHQLRRHAHLLQRLIHAEPLLERHAVVELAVDDERRRLEVLDVGARRKARIQLGVLPVC